MPLVVFFYTQKLREVKENKACYNSSCRKTLAETSYVDDKGHSFCNKTCSDVYADIVKKKNDEVSVRRIGVGYVVGCVRRDSNSRYLYILDIC
jgi:hypothetical protein